MRCPSSDLASDELPLDCIACWRRANRSLQNDSLRPLIFREALCAKPFPDGRGSITMIQERLSGSGGWPSPRCHIAFRLTAETCTPGAPGTACSSPESSGRRQGSSRPIPSQTKKISLVVEPEGVKELEPTDTVVSFLAPSRVFDADVI